MKKLIALLSAAILAISPVMNIEAIDTPEADALPADAAISAPLGDPSDVPADTTEDDTVSPAEVIPGEVDGAEDTGTDSPAEHEHIWEWQPDDDNYHSLKCTICGENQGSKGSHRYALNDYSDFLFPDIIGLPANDGLAILRERFGEEALQLTDLQTSDNSIIYHLKFCLLESVCQKCGYDSQNSYYSGHYIAIENGIITTVYAAFHVQDSTGPSSIGYLNNHPKFSNSLPINITYGDLKTYRDMGRAVIDGEEFNVEYEESDYSGVKGGKTYEFYFVTDKYTVNYTASNYINVFDPETGKTTCQIMEPDDSLHFMVSSIFLTQDVNPNEHEHNWEWQSDDSFEHSMKCTICGEVLESERHEYQKNDYSDFVFSDIIGMPADEGLAILKERFGEESLQLTESQAEDGATEYYLRVLLCGNTCLKCGYVSANTYYSGNYITIKNGIIEKIRASISLEDVIGPVVYRDYSPKYTVSLPTSITYSDLLMYREAGKAVINGEEFKVEYEETPVDGYPEGHVLYQFFFITDKYTANYNASNYNAVFDSETGQATWQIMEPDPGSNISLYNISATQKVVPADVDGNGSVTLDDALLTLKCAMNIGLGDETFNKQAADVTGDGNITVDDAIAVLKIAMNVKQ